MFKILKRFKKIIVVLILGLFLILVFSLGKVYDKKELEYGLTFAKKHALSLDLPWKDVYLEMLDELKIKKLRLSAYWDEAEPEKNKFDYTDLDWQINEASKRDVEIILAVGLRLPRWPECHLPDWAIDLEKEEREEEILEYIKKTIERYSKNKNIFAWQVENEPFLLGFGECPKFDVNFLDKEIALVKKLDSRPIIVTDSGELSFWVQAAKRSDIFGTSIYLNTYSQKLKKYIHYPITPKFFHFKKNMTKLFANPKDWIVIELQAEPWGLVSYKHMSEEEKAITMDLEKFKEMINFSHQAGFKTFYLWGVEWWYWEKEINGNQTFWKEAKKLF
jgi:hypothetical protein